MNSITEIKVKVERSLALDNKEYVVYSIEAKASVKPDEAILKVYEDTLAFCQTRLIEELERIERGDAPKRSNNVYNEDYVPDFKPHNTFNITKVS